MSNNQKDYTGEIFASAVVVVALALLVAAFKLGAHLAAWWIVIIFQVLLTGAGVIVGGAFTLWVAQSLFESIAQHLRELQRSHDELITYVRRRVPTFIAAALVITEAAMIIADKAFKSETLPTVTVSLLLLVLFWVANEFMTSGSTFRRGIGIALWIFAILFLPLAVFLHRKGDWSAIKAEIESIQFGHFWALVLIGVLMLVLPFAFQTHDDDA